MAAAAKRSNARCLNLDARAPRPGIVAGDNTGLSMNTKVKVGLFLEHQHDQNGSVQVIPTSLEAVAQTRREDHGDLDGAGHISCGRGDATTTITMASNGETNAHTYVGRTCMIRETLNDPGAMEQGLCETSGQVRKV